MENETISILYLDDELPNLHAFKAAFRRNFKVYCALTPQEALNVLRSEHIHVFLVDQRLQDTKGTDLLKDVALEFPEMINILVSGCFEDEAFLQEIALRGEIFRFIKKPWIESELRGAIEDGYKVYGFLTGKKRELDDAKLYLSHSVKAPIANLEGLISLARIEINDVYALKDYLEYMSQSLETLKVKLEYLHSVEVR